MGKAKERGRVDRVVVCGDNLIRFEGMPVVVWLVWRDGCGLFLFVHSLHKSDLLLHAVYYNLQKTDNRNE